MAAMKPPFYPIIYVRGYAMTGSEIDDTTADPFCGFNVGSTVYRAVANRKDPPRKHIFESPIVRLMSEYGYEDAFVEGKDIVDPEWGVDDHGEPRAFLPARSVIIHRYYDEASNLLGSGKTPKIETFANELGKLILRARELVCANPANKVAPADFRCHLVAHSMGGLVCRALLQNPACDQGKAARFVDKFFTYATPHNGIDVAGLNVPSWLKLFDISNFDRDKRMPAYLDLKDAHRRHKRVDLVPEDRFPSRRIFCMVGTNRLDYDVAAGLSRTFVGHGSDGLVRIENATLHGLKADGSIGEPCAKAFAYRAHSGYFGIVNSEEAYQNLKRFLFGNVRVDVWLDVDQVRLPPEVQAVVKGTVKVNALYQVEMHASPRGMLWMLTRRKAEEDSVSCFTHADWKKGGEGRHHHLSTVFLDKDARVDRSSSTLSYMMNLGVRVPDYEIDRRLWVNRHYEGSYLFNGDLLVEVSPPRGERGKWRVACTWQGSLATSVDVEISADEFISGRAEVCVPIQSFTIEAGEVKIASPGIEGSLRLVISPWS